MEEVLPRCVRSLLGATVADEVIPGEQRVVVAPHVSTGAEPPAHTGQHDHPDVGIIIAGPHVLTDLGYGTVFLRVADECVHALRAVELDPEDARFFRLVQQVIDQLRAFAGSTHFQRTLVTHLLTSLFR